MSTTITYVGNSTIVGGGNGGTWGAVLGFIDTHEPVPGKSEWGMDTLMRTMRGTQPNLATFVASLAQGTTYTFNGNTFYLQSWEPDGNPVFPSVTMNYKGLTGGIPTPKASGGTVEQTLTLSAQSVGIYTTATREIRYLTRQSSTLYIATTAPTAGSHGLDVSFDVYSSFISSVIRATDSSGNDYVFAGATAPSALVSALTPVGTLDRIVPHSSPVVGSPWHECEDTCVRLLPGGN